MPSFLKSVIKEYGLSWIFNRLFYSFKLKLMRVAPFTEKLYEKSPPYPKRLDIFSINVEKLRAFIHELPEEDKTHLIESADKACKGIINAFSSIELDYGDPVDWQLNPLTGKRCDEKIKWYKIPDFDKERGDIKVIWEASRFSHFLTLARAYLLTEEQKYYEAFSSQLKNWLEENFYSYGANFKCGQECSIRMVNTLLAYSVFKDCELITDADISNIKDLVDRCYRKVLSNFFYAYKCIKNNHTVSELMGMIIGAWCCDDRKQLEKAYKWLDGVIDEQFTEDGGYRQFSFNYQRLALQDLECVLALDLKTGKSLNEHSKAKIKNAALLMYQCQDETGDMPNYGSNDGALIFPVTSCGYRDFRPTINTVYALITAKQLYEPGKHQEELIWFSGGNKEFRNYKTIARKSSQFPEAGLFTIREPNSWAMIICNDYHSRPAHMDQLHFDLWIDGVNVLCDAGTYSYASEEGRKLAKNESHNTVMVNNVPQMNTKGPFMTYGWTERRLGRTETDFFESTVKSTNGYIHKRKIQLQEYGYLIIDEVDDNASLLFHTPYDVSIVANETVISKNGIELAAIKSMTSSMISECRRSLFYLKQEKTTCIAFNVKAKQEVHTMIYTRNMKNGQYEQHYCNQ